MGNLGTGPENGLVEIDSQRRAGLEGTALPRAAGDGPEAHLCVSTPRVGTRSLPPPQRWCARSRYSTKYTHQGHQCMTLMCVLTNRFVHPIFLLCI